MEKCVMKVITESGIRKGITSVPKEFRPLCKGGDNFLNICGEVKTKNMTRGNNGQYELTGLKAELKDHGISAGDFIVYSQKDGMLCIDFKKTHEGMIGFRTTGLVRKNGINIRKKGPFREMTAKKAIIYIGQEKEQIGTYNIILSDTNVITGTKEIIEHCKMGEEVDLEFLGINETGIIIRLTYRLPWITEEIKREIRVLKDVELELYTKVMEGGRIKITELLNRFEGRERDNAVNGLKNLIGVRQLLMETRDGLSRWVYPVVRNGKPATEDEIDEIRKILEEKNVR